MQFTATTNINKIFVPEWDSFIKNHPNRTVFQSSEILELFEGSENFKPVPVQVSLNVKIAGILLGVIIKEYSGMIGFFTSRTVIYGGPLIDPALNDKPQVIDFLLKELIKEVKN